MNMNRIVSTLAPTLACALVAFVPAGASGTSAADADGRLGVSTFVVGGHSLASVSVASADAIARVTVTVPSGYTFDLGKPAGTSLGFASAVLSDGAGTSSAFADGELVVDDPARYATDPGAQACAPGAHSAVWRTTFSVLGQEFSLPIFVDVAGPTEPDSTAFVLRFCPIWSSPAVPAGVTANQVSFLVEDAVTQPAAPGRYTWSAFVTPPMAASIAPDLAQTFELRTVVPFPHTLTLRARHDPKAKTVVLSGKMTAAGQPEPGVEISFAASTDSFSETAFFGPVTTNASGEFSIRRHVERTTQFSASVDPRTRPCQAPSSAPAGCPAETVSPPPSASAVVRVRGANDPRLAARARDQALARRINLKLSDFPAGWEAFDTFPLWTCAGFKPRLRDLTVSGDFESRAFASEQAVASSRASVYLSEAQARVAFRREARLEAVRCWAKEVRAEGANVLQLGAVPFRPLGSETRAFRLVFAEGEQVVTLDLVSFRQRRVVVHLGFASVVQALPIEEDLAAKVAARARGG
jgi:hypothetical protein